MIGPIDPTGRADRHTNRKLFRLLGLLAGVFVVGTGIGWIVGQIGHPVAETGSQNVATTLPAALPPATSPAPGSDALVPPAPQPAPAATPATPLPQPATASATDQHAATNFIAQATQQPPLAISRAPSPPAAVDSGPAAAKAVPPASTSPSSEPEVVIEPVPESTAPPETVKPAQPVTRAASKPRAVRPSRQVEAQKHHPTSRTAARHGAAEAASRVTVIGAKGAPAGTRWTIQLGAFRGHDHAALLVMTLQSHGTAATVIKRDDGAKGVWYLVRTPGLASLKAATTAAAAISRRERLAAYVMRASAP